MRFGLKDGATLALADFSPHLRFSDHAWESTVHATPRRTVDTSVTVMASMNTALVNRKLIHVAKSRVRYRATHLISDDARILSGHL